MALVMKKRQDGSYRLLGDFPEFHVFSATKIMELMLDGVVSKDGDEITLKFENGNAVYREVQIDKDDPDDPHFDYYTPNSIALELVGVTDSG